MEISFETIEIRSICERKDIAIEKMGALPAQKLRIRLADLLATTTLKDLASNKMIIVSNSSEESIITMELAEGWFLNFSANHQKNPLNSDQKVDWEKVRRIKILSIVRNV